MSTDYRALCAELAQVLAEEYGVQGDFDSGEPLLGSGFELLSRARTALAQPEPEGVGLSDEKLLDLADDCGLEKQEITTWDGESRTVDHGWECTDAQLVTFATALITRYARPTTEPVPVAEDVPHEEILRLAAEEIGYEFTGQWFLTGGKELTLETNPLELLNFAHAILTRWGRPTTEPVPVAERLPEPRGMFERILCVARSSGGPLVGNIQLADRLLDAVVGWAGDAVPVSERFEFSVFNSEYEEQAGGTAPTYAEALSYGQHYLSQYSQDGPHSLEIRRVEVLSHHALPVPGAEVQS